MPPRTRYNARLVCPHCKGETEALYSRERQLTKYGRATWSFKALPGELRWCPECSDVVDHAIAVEVAHA